MWSRRRAGDSDAPPPSDLDPRGRHRGARSPLRALRRVGRAAGVLTSVGLLLLSAYVWYTWRDINNGVHRIVVPVGQPPSDHPVAFAGTAMNILIVGEADRSGLTRYQQLHLKVGRDSSLATDTMMIVHIPADGSKATLISLPRDAYVAVPGYGMNKLNAAYVDGYLNSKGSTDQRTAAGAAVLIRTVSNLTGLTINHYVQVSFLGFYDLAKAIGGIPVNLCHAVDDTVAYNRSQGIQGGSGFDMSAGHHVLNAVQALEFVRQRHNFPNGLGDLDRVRRQQYFLTAAFRKVATVGIVFKLHALGDTIKRDLYIDQDLNLTDLALQLEKLSANNIVGETIPFEGFDNRTPVGSVEIVSPARIRAFIERHISRTAQPNTLGRRLGASRRRQPLDARCIQ